jgi:hypothetical protein
MHLQFRFLHAFGFFTHQHAIVAWGNYRARAHTHACIHAHTHTRSHTHTHNAGHRRIPLLLIGIKMKISEP